MKSRYWKTTHKFGIRIPRSVEEAPQIDKETGTTSSRDAIEKEMKKVRIAFEAWDGTVEQARSKKYLIGYQYIKCRFNFEVKPYFRGKARFIAGEHMTDPSDTLTYSSVVS